jgi:hypothetical protein
MPQVAAAAIAGYQAIVGVAAAPLVGLLGEGGAIALAGGAIKSAAAAAALQAASALVAPDIGGGGNPTDWVADPDAPLRYAIGRGGAAGQIVHRDEYGPDNMYQSIVAVIAAGGPIKGFVSWEFDDQPVTFNASTGAATSSQWLNEMWVTTRRGLQPETALTSPAGLKNGAALPGWTSASKLSGKAAYMLTMAENSKRSAFPTGEPKPLVTWEGCYGWDPRLDDTWPGGSGSCRLNDPATYVWIDNPALGALKWATGLWEGPSSGGKYGVPHDSVLVGGFGSKVEGIDVASFVEAANIADVNGWTVAAYPSSADNKAQVMDALLQACGAIYAERAGRISCIHRAAPRASVVTISAADTAGPLELDTTVSRIGRINTIRPRYWSEANRWQMTAADAVTASAYLAEDNGERRTRGVDFPFVRDVQQASELAALQLANTREGFRGVIPLKPHLQRIKPGDAFTITEPGFLLDGQKFLCLDTEFDAATGVHRVTFVSETDGKYDFAFGLSPEPPPAATLSPNPGPPNAPDIADWTITPREPPETGGNLPGLDLSGAVNNATAYRMLVEYGPSATGPWTAAYEGPPTAEKLSVNVPAGGAYYLAVTYFDRAGISSERTVFGPYEVAGLSAGLDPETLEDLNLRAAVLIAADIAEAQARYTDVTRRKEEIRAESEARQTAINLVETTVEEVATDLQAEITTRTDQISALNGQVASVSSATTTNATNISAVATRTTVLEAQVQTPTTGLLSRATSLESRVTTVETGKASASSVDILAARVGDNEAEIASVSSVAADAQGKVNAVVSLRTSVNGRIAGTRLVNDGTTSLFDIEADALRVFNGTSDQPVFQVAGGQVLVANERVATESMVANAVTLGAVAVTAGALTHNQSGWEQIQSLTLTTTGRKCQVSVTFFQEAAYVSDPTVQCRIVRGSTVIFEGIAGRTSLPQTVNVRVGGSLDANYEVDIPGQLAAMASFFVEDTPAAGSHTWSLQVFSPGSSLVVRQRGLSVVEFKR